MRASDAWPVLVVVWILTGGSVLQGAPTASANAPSSTTSVSASRPNLRDYAEQQARRPRFPDPPEAKPEATPSPPRAPASSRAPAADPAGDREEADSSDPSRSRSSETLPHADAPAGGSADAEVPLFGPGSSSGSSPSGSRGQGSRSSGLRGGNWVLSTFAALGLVIAVILFLRWGWLKLSGQRQVGDSPVVEVLSRTAVAPKSHVLLLRVGERILVVGDSASGGLRTLREVGEPEEVADLLGAVTASRDQSISKNFSQMLGRFSGEYDADRAEDHEGRDSGEHVLDRTRDSVHGLLTRVRGLSNERRGDP